MTEQNTLKITHDEMIDTLKGLVFGTFDRTTAKEREALNMAIETLEQEPKTGHWISIDDRLPKNDEDVLVCSSQGAMEVCYYHIDDTYYPTQYADLNETGWFNEDDGVLGFEPIAWMPLPEPYETKESEE